MVLQQLVSCVCKIFYSETVCSLGAGALPASEERLAAGPPVLSGLLVASHRSIVLILLPTWNIRFPKRINVLVNTLLSGKQYYSLALCTFPGLLLLCNRATQLNG